MRGLYLKVKLIWVNFLLTLLIFLLAYMIFQVWTSPDAPGAAREADNGKALEENRIVLVKRGQSKSDYSDVVQKNIFSMDRREFVPKAVDVDSLPEEKMQNEPAPLETKQVTLFGVMFVGDFKKALVNDQHDRENPQKWVREGDLVADYRITQIEKDRIILSRAGKLHTVLLYDKDNPKKRTMVSPARKTSAARPPKAKTAKTDSAGPGKTPADKSVGSKETPGSAKDEYEIIQTPFGEFKRKKSK